MSVPSRFALYCRRFMQMTFGKIITLLLGKTFSFHSRWFCYWFEFVSCYQKTFKTEGKINIVSLFEWLFHRSLYATLIKYTSVCYMTLGNSRDVSVHMGIDWSIHRLHNIYTCHRTCHWVVWRWCWFWVVGQKLKLIFHSKNMMLRLLGSNTRCFSKISTRILRDSIDTALVRANC